ncbi:MAG: OpgC domain-containing protein [Chloroflexota bacterium]
MFRSLFFKAFRYPFNGKRDLRLDWLRGFALFVMSINHAGLDSYFHIVTGNAQFLINAAEGFFFISGFTLGFISIGREIKSTVIRTLRRAWIVYLAVLGLGFGFAAVDMLFIEELALWGEVDDETYGSLIHWATGIFTMFRSAYGSDILIAYVVYLGVAPLSLWALFEKKSWRVLAVAFFVYVLSQISNEQTSLPFASFRHLAANNLIFFGGMLIGYRKERLANWWRAHKFNSMVDLVTVALGVIFLLGYIDDYEWFPFGQALFLNSTIEIREFYMPPFSLLIVFLYFRVFFILITVLWRPLNALFGWLVLPLGQSSLETFNLHLIGMAILWATPGVKENASLAIGTLWNVYYLALIYIPVRAVGVLRNRVWEGTPLGQKLFPHIALILTTVCLFAFVGIGALKADPVWDWNQYAYEEEGEAEIEAFWEEAESLMEDCEDMAGCDFAALETWIDDCVERDFECNWEMLDEIMGWEE